MCVCVSKPHRASPLRPRPLCCPSTTPPPAAGYEAANQLFHDIQNIIIRALLAVQPAMINDKHCFELYGWAGAGAQGQRVGGRG